jgi:iron complex outermembrane receptor protein
MNQDNKPVKTAVVSIPEFKISSYTDENGKIEFINLGEGKFHLQIIRLGYHDYSQEINLKNEKVLTLNIKMKQHPLQAEEILVTSMPYSLLPQTEILSAEIRERYPKDVGIFLREYSEFGGIRKGGYATDPFYNFYFSGATKDMENYKNGSGVVIPSSYRISDYSVKMGLFPFENHHFQLSWRQSFTRDILHAGLPMDTNEDNTTLWSIDYKARNLSSTLFSVTGKFHLSDLNHIMDNLRRPNSSMVQAVSSVSSKTMGGKRELGISFISNSLWYFGTDLYRIKKDGSRDRLVSVNPCNMMVFDPARSFTDPVWQNLDWTDGGIFTEWHQILKPNFILIAGARVDFVSSLSKEPAPQFIEKYGDVGRLNETNLSASLILNYDLNLSTNLKFAAGRGVRSSNIAERYINHLTIGQDPYEYFGNPGLKPEVNHQIEMSVEKRLYQWQFTGNVFFASIHNFITAAVSPDIVRLYLPCQDSKNAKNFLNINRATQTGFEFEVNANFTRTLAGRGTVGYTWSKNHEWNKPLPEIPPIEAKLAIRYNHIFERFWVEAEGRFAAQQDRISNSFCETETAAFSVYNLLAGFKPFYFLDLEAGVYNIFNKTYYEHLNRRYQNQPIHSVVYEPGRNVFVILRLQV